MFGFGKKKKIFLSPPTSNTYGGGYKKYTNGSFFPVGVMPKFTKPKIK